ncbi:uncharacterized protein LOC105421427 isoform X1 [Amborella trichopoda]|uniref:uncharacterized protein LOC105421427 isoform X1 n=1 Tax=Amborella trichopoda TaxID=13333 RepID=UPI0009C0C93D|nr:uncharacterized protein LOC105421427 isoform X1 [Amborella trichopoda]|eukprot:XP_020529383.1 uncharacterized protein LOC105421427 isoform X1 [Amborella trichopoda]
MRFSKSKVSSKENLYEKVIKRTLFGGLDFCHDMNLPDREKDSEFDFCCSESKSIAAASMSQLGKIWQVHNLTEVHLDSIIIQQKEKLDQLDDKEIEAKEIQRLKCCYDIAMTRCIRRFCQGACPLDAIV